jgi:hypothetical protein
MAGMRNLLAVIAAAAGALVVGGSSFAAPRDSVTTVSPASSRVALPADCGTEFAPWGRLQVWSRGTGCLAARLLMRSSGVLAGIPRGPFYPPAFFKTGGFTCAFNIDVTCWTGPSDKKARLHYHQTADRASRVVVAWPYAAVAGGPTVRAAAEVLADQALRETGGTPSGWTGQCLQSEGTLKGIVISDCYLASQSHSGCVIAVFLYRSHPQRPFPGNPGRYEALGDQVKPLGGC